MRRDMGVSVSDHYPNDFFTLGIYGDGSDGDVVLSATTTTMTRDMFYNTLEVPSGKTLKTGGYRVHCKGLMTVAGTVQNNGIDG